MKWPRDYIGAVMERDCLGALKAIPDNSIDLLLTDPPYGIKENSHRQQSRTKLAPTTNYGAFDWDQKLDAVYFKEMLRVARAAIIFGGNYYADFLPPSSCWIVWDKDNAESNFADCELAWTSFNSAVRKIKWRWNGMIQEDMKDKEPRYHPTQKPLAVMKWILRKYSQENDIILDPFLGSGTTAVAAASLGRRWSGIEKDPKYCDIARRRLSEVQSEMFT